MAVDNLPLTRCDVETCRRQRRNTLIIGVSADHKILRRCVRFRFSYTLCVEYNIGTSFFESQVKECGTGSLHLVDIKGMQRTN